MPYEALLLLYWCWSCGWVCTAAAAETDRSSSDACYYTSAAAVAAIILDVVPLLLSLLFAGEAIYSAQDPYIGVLSAWVLGV